MVMKNLTTRVIRVAIAQFAPAYHNKTASLTKALEFVRKAASEGAALIAFGAIRIVSIQPGGRCSDGRGIQPKREEE